MNKQGAIIHWIIFGVLIAMAIFFVGTYKETTTNHIKGEWALHFLMDNYLEAEKVLLVQESVERNVGLEVAEEMALNGGWRSGEVSACGVVENTNLWNMREGWCLPEVRGNFTSRASEKLKVRIPRGNFSEVYTTGKYFRAQGEKEEINSLLLKEAHFPADQRYFYDTSFAVDLGYSFEEYTQLGSEAKLLVEKCRNMQEFMTCVEKSLPIHWRVGSCDGKTEIKNKEAGERRALFCVQSPNLYTLSTGRVGERKKVKYSLALDFSPSKILPVEKVSVSHDAGLNGFIVTFPSNFLAEGYKIYYTDWLSVVGYTPGKAIDIFSTVPKDPTLGFYESAFVKKEEILPCSDAKEAMKAYLCNGNIMYVLQEGGLHKDKPYMLGVTAFDGKEESILEEFVELKY